MPVQRRCAKRSFCFREEEDQKEDGEEWVWHQFVLMKYTTLTPCHIHILAECEIVQHWRLRDMVGCHQNRLRSQLCGEAWYNTRLLGISQLFRSDFRVTTIAKEWECTWDRHRKWKRIYPIGSVVIYFPRTQCELNRLLFSPVLGPGYTFDETTACIVVTFIALHWLIGNEAWIQRDTPNHSGSGAILVDSGITPFIFLSIPKVFHVLLLLAS